MVPGGRGGSAKVLHAKMLGPDWAGMSDAQGENNILPGDTKLSRNWESKDIPTIVHEDGTLINLNDAKEGIALVAPLKQLLHYCIQSDMRYGYFITDKELVVFRVGPEHKRRSDDGITFEMTDSAIMEWQSIPWKTHGKDNQMTVNIGLWVLHLLAANNGALDWEYKELTKEILGDTESRMRKKLKPQSPETQVQLSFQSTTTDADRSDGDPSYDIASIRSDASRVSNVPVTRKRYLPSIASRTRKRQRSNL